VDHDDGHQQAIRILPVSLGYFGGFRRSIGLKHGFDDSVMSEELGKGEELKVLKREVMKFYRAMEGRKSSHVDFSALYVFESLKHLGVAEMKIGDERYFYIGEPTHHQQMIFKVLNIKPPTKCVVQK